MSQKSHNNKEPLDAWVIFEHLYGAQRKDLIDYLIHQLYYLSDDDIDFFVPQLCTLLISRTEEISKQLECYILYKCMKSIDFAIKCFWNLHAIQFYSKLEGHKNRCDEMRQNLEMIVVNGQLPRNLFIQLPKDIQKEEKILLEQSKNKEQKEQQSNNGHHNNNNNNNNNIFSNGKKALSSALPQPKKPNNIKNIKNINDPLLNGATEYLKKQRRCTYFNAELDFAHFLEGVSSALEQCDREDRPRLLEDNIRYANKCLPRGLYIPIAHNASDSHKSLLRIVPNEGKCLDSKQKVPFLLFCEIEQHLYPTSSPLICEELTESETALLSSSGLYVLIDEHRKRHNKSDKNKHKNHKHKNKNKQLQKKDNPKRLKPTKRKPSKPILYNKKQKEIRKNKSNTPTPPKDIRPDISILSISADADPVIDCNEYSIPSKDIHSPQYTSNDSNSNDDDDSEIKTYTPDDYISEPSKSKTNTHTNTNTNGHNNKRMAISSIPTPQPKPIDKIAEQAMKRHLEALKPFEPNNNNNNNNEQLLTPNDKKKIESQSQSQLLSSPNNKHKNKQINNNNHSSMSRMFGRSRTPEPDKHAKNNNKNINNGKIYMSKSDCSSDDNNNNNNNMVKPTIIVNSKVGVVQSIKYNNNNNNKKSKKGKINQPSVVIYRHPNYENSKIKKLQYLRGKSMQWKDPFGESWNKRTERYKEQSPFKTNMKWNMQSVIFKSGEDMRQEQMAMQFIKLFNKIWKHAKLPLQLHPYSVIVTSPASGFVETVPNSVSISRLKHSIINFVSLRKFFEQFYGPVGSPGFQMAQKNFVESMAGYSLVSYFLQIKDRHNGNILLTNEGRIVHIDFDFLFSNSPGGNIGFESAPFKLTEEFIQVMGGEENSEMFDYFKILLIRGFLEARKHVRKFLLLSKIMIEGAPMPCFLLGQSVITQLKDRFATKLKNEKCVEHVYNLIEESSCNWRSIQYDKFQRITNNIL